MVRINPAWSWLMAPPAGQGQGATVPTPSARLEKAEEKIQKKREIRKRKDQKREIKKKYDQKREIRKKENQKGKLERKRIIRNFQVVF